MTTQLEYARQNTVTKEMQIVAQAEGLSEAFVRENAAKGEIVIPCNPNRKYQKVTGIGTGLKTKVNASIGTSSDICDISFEVEKAKAAQEEGADTLMELSTGGIWGGRLILKGICSRCGNPVARVIENE